MPACRCSEYKEGLPMTEIGGGGSGKTGLVPDRCLNRRCCNLGGEKDFLWLRIRRMLCMKLALGTEGSRFPVSCLKWGQKVSAKIPGAAIYPFFGQTCNFLKLGRTWKTNKRYCRRRGFELRIYHPTFRKSLNRSTRGKGPGNVAKTVSRRTWQHPCNPTILTH